MPDGNSKRDWREYQHIYYELIKYYKATFSQQEGYKQQITEIEGKSIKLVDATINECFLSLFDWA